MVGPGHNSGDKGISQERLKAFVQRIERVESEQTNLKTDKKEIYTEAKSGGFDTKAIRKLVRHRKADAAKLAEEQAVFDTYLSALGDLASTPLGRAAANRVSAKG